MHCLLRWHIFISLRAKAINIVSSCSRYTLIQGIKNSFHSFSQSPHSFEEQRGKTCRLNSQLCHTNISNLKHFRPRKLWVLDITRWVWDGCWEENFFHQIPNLSALIRNLLVASTISLRYSREPALHRQC